MKSILRIIVDGFSAATNKRFSALLNYIALPIIMIILAIFQPIRISDVDNYIYTGISIFTGLFFSLLLSVNTKVKEFRDRDNSDKDLANSYKDKWRNVSNITQLLILIGVIIVILVLSCYLLPDDLSCKNAIIKLEMYMSYLVLFLTGIYFSLIIGLLVRLKYLLDADLK